MSHTPEYFLKKYIQPTDTVVIGVSGGPDSVYLLMQCLQYTPNIVVAHVRHPQRRIGSRLDAAFVKKLAGQHSLKFETITIENPKKGNLEDQFRQQRYEFFEKIKRKYKAKWILTAHHLNDNIETVLFNLAKGSFIKGLSGMQVTTPKKQLLRPLLYTTKDQILTWLKKKRIPYRLDHTNKNTMFARNRLRHRVIPELKSINNNLESTFSDNIVNLQELNSFLQTTTAAWMSKNIENNQLPLEKFRQLHPILQKNVLFQLHKNLYGPSRDLSQQHLKQLLKIIHQTHGNKKKEFGKYHIMRITKNGNKKILEITDERLKKEHNKVE